MIPKDYGFAPGEFLRDSFGNLLAQPDQLRRLFNRIRPTFTITGATNAKPIVITTKVRHFLTTGEEVTITGVKGNTAANGVFTITKTAAMPDNTFSLDGSEGNGNYATGTGSVVLAQRGKTIDQPKTIGTLNELITHLTTSGDVAKPIGDIYLGAHASIGGKLALKLFRAQDFDEPRGVISSYETLEETLRPDTPPPPALAKRTIKIPAALVGDPATRPQLFVHLRGCNIGQSGPFMAKWKEALGPNAKTTASKYEHGVVDLSKRLIDKYGSWEYYMYAFTVNRPGPRRVDPPAEPKPIRTRDELVEAFREARELEGDDELNHRLKFIDGTIVSDVAGDLWDQWIPKEKNVVTKPRRKPLRNPLNEATGNRGTVEVRWGLIVLPNFYQHFINFPPGSFPANPDEAKRKFIENLESLPNFKPPAPAPPPNHPFPVYQREGYFSLTNFIEGYNWEFNGPSAGPGGTLRMQAIGERRQFILFVPVTIPNPGRDPDKTDILFNFFPSEGTTHRPVIQVRSDDPRFFDIR